MSYVVLIVIALMLGGAAEAYGADTGAARERMTPALFAEYEGGFEYDGYRAGYERQLTMKSEGRWWPVELTVACAAGRCTGRIVAEATHTVVLVDRAEFRGRKGTYHESGWREP